MKGTLHAAFVMIALFLVALAAPARALDLEGAIGDAADSVAKFAGSMATRIRYGACPSGDRCFVAHNALHRWVPYVRPASPICVGDRSLSLTGTGSVEFGLKKQLTIPGYTYQGGDWKTYITIFARDVNVTAKDDSQARNFKLDLQPGQCFTLQNVTDEGIAAAYDGAWYEYRAETTIDGHPLSLIMKSGFTSEPVR